MKVDSHIVKAFDRYAREHNLNYEDLANMFGVTKASITKWRKVGNGITAQRWNEIFPVIKEYLPKDRIFINDAQEEQYSSAAAKQSDYVFEPKYVPLMVHIFNLNNISQYDNTLESVMQFGERMKLAAVEYHPKHKEKTSIFALALDDNAYAPILPEKTTLFASAGESPVDGNLVIALTSGSKKAIIGRYHRTDDTFEISPIGDYSKIAGQVREAKSLISWVFPVLYYEVVTF